MNVFDKDNLLFISFEPGGGGHKFARIIATLPEVYWYSNERNGRRPWNVHSTNPFRQRKISKNHFDRIMPNGHMLPPTWDLLSEFIPDEDFYYNNIYEPQFKLAGGYDISQFIPICTHSLPSKIRKYFTNSKIINLIGDANVIARRNLKTTAFFPAYLKLDWITGRDTDYGKYLYEVSKELGENFTKQDLWLYEHKNLTYDDYVYYINSVITNNMYLRTTENVRNTLTIANNHYKMVKTYLSKE